MPEDPFSHGAAKMSCDSNGRAFIQSVIYLSIVAQLSTSFLTLLRRVGVDEGR